MQVSKVLVDAYIGDDEPPHCVMFASCYKHPGGNYLIMEVTLNGTIPLTTIDTIQIPVNDDMCDNDTDTDSD